MAKKRKWWQKKTNWSIIVGLASQVMALIPVIAPYSLLVLKIAAIAGVYSVADRAGKPNEGE